MQNRLSILFLTVFAIIGLLPLIQQSFGPIKLAGLQGAYEGGEMPKLTLKSWFNGNFQKKMDFYLKYNTAFNGELVRFRNQIDFSIFNNINTSLTLGKENYIYDPNYITAREGTNLLSDSSFEELKHSVKTTLKWFEQNDIPLLVLFPPNKANYYSEYLANKSIPGKITNKLKIKNLLESSEVDLIDFDSWFLEQKTSTKHPLIPKYGAHWSNYGAALAADSILNYINSTFVPGNKLFSIVNLELTNEVKFTDDDYLPSLNLMYKWESPQLAYPELNFQEGSKPTILIISDSYIWSLYDLQVIQKCFSEKSKLLYYFKSVYDTKRNKIGELNSGISLKDIQEFDLICILNSDAGLNHFGYGFFENMNKNLSHE